MVNSLWDSIYPEMGKQTIADFVEDQQILDKLNKIGSDYVQGYYLGMPMPLPELKMYV